MTDTSFPSNSILSELLPGIIHEINNPLGAVMMNIAILLEDLDDSKLNEDEVEELRETYQDMDNALGKIKDYIQSLGYLSVQRFYEEPTGIDLRYAVNHSINLMHNKLKRVVRVDNRLAEHGYLFINVRIASVLTALCNIYSQIIESEGGNTLVIDGNLENGKIKCSITREGLKNSLEIDKLSSFTGQGDFTFILLENGITLFFNPHDQQSEPMLRE